MADTENLIGQDEKKIFVIDVFFDGQLVGKVRIVARDEASALTDMYKRTTFAIGTILIANNNQIQGVMPCG